MKISPSRILIERRNEKYRDVIVTIAGDFLLNVEVVLSQVIGYMRGQFSNIKLIHV